MGDVLDAGTRLLGVQVVVPYNHGAGVTPVKLFEQSSHGSLLRFGACISGLTADVQPALVADAYRVGVVVLAVGTDQPFRTAWLYRSVPTDHVVVADAELPALTAMPRVNLSGRTFGKLRLLRLFLCGCKGTIFPSHSDTFYKISYGLMAYFFFRITLKSCFYL